jgi:rubrerythrin
MTINKPVEIIKSALLLERKGKAFYESVARQTRNEAIRQFFDMLAKEEEQHVEVLTRQYVNLVREGTLVEAHYDEVPQDTANSVLTEQIRKEISAASYEAAAISAAIAMEDKAVSFYSQQAAASQSAVEKGLFQWLASWEKTHLKFLVDIDTDLQEAIWYDNQFWPVI